MLNEADKPEVLVLQGPLKGCSKVLEGVAFRRGRATVTGAGLKRILRNSYQAIPIRELEESDGGTEDASGGAGGAVPQVGGPVPDDGRAANAPSQAGPGATGAATGDKGSQAPGIGSRRTQAQIEAITAALKELDPEDDDHWASDGSPAVDAVATFSGVVDLSRGELARFTVGVTRPPRNPDLEPFDEDDDLDEE